MKQLFNQLRSKVPDENIISIDQAEEILFSTRTGETGELAVFDEMLITMSNICYRWGEDQNRPGAVYVPFLRNLIDETERILSERLDEARAITGWRRVVNKTMVKLGLI